MVTVAQFGSSATWSAGPRSGGAPSVALGVRLPCRGRPVIACRPGPRCR